MKKAILLLAAILMIAACSRNFEKFELFGAESFAYSMDSGWELNASVRAKGFDQSERGNKFTAKLSYFTNLQTPDGRLIKKISSGVVDKTSGEKLVDFPIETQIKLDSTFITGIYKITFIVKDEGSEKQVYSSSFFELTK